MYFVLAFANFCKNKHGILIEFINTVLILERKAKSKSLLKDLNKIFKQWLTIFSILLLQNMRRIKKLCEGLGGIQERNFYDH